MTCKAHSRNECSLYWDAVVSGKACKEGELWPGGRHHVGHVDRPTQEMINVAQECGLAPKVGTATDREARGDAGIHELSEVDCEMVCVVLEGGGTLYQSAHWGSEGEGHRVQAGPGRRVKAGQGDWIDTSTRHGFRNRIDGVKVRLVPQEGRDRKAECVAQCSDGTTGWGLTRHKDQHGEDSFSWWQDGTQAQEPGTEFEAASQDDVNKVPQGCGDVGRRGQGEGRAPAALKIRHKVSIG